MPRATASRAAAKTAASQTKARKRSRSPSSSDGASASDSTVPASKAIRMSYRIGRGEEGVLTFEPYKSHLLPLWRFKTPEIARESSEKLWKEFLRADEEGDFVWMDMARKFEQMGMTRATRYARRAGGRKYDKETGDLLPTSTDHPGAQEKLESAAIFRAVWERCKAHEGYGRRREEWEKEKKEWEKGGKKAGKSGGQPEVKDEEEEEEEEKPAPPKRRRVKRIKDEEE
ncbi:hypothetical protein JCM6882_006822 [Rhodosporidiobolus microsporus]